MAQTRTCPKPLRGPRVTRKKSQSDVADMLRARLLCGTWQAQTASYGVLPGPAGSGMENTFLAQVRLTPRSPLSFFRHPTAPWLYCRCSHTKGMARCLLLILCAYASPSA